MKKGFTLLEILLVIAAIGILAAIVIIALNPQRQLSQVRNAERRSDVSTLNKALNQYLIDTGGFPGGVESYYLEVCDTGDEQVGGPTDCTGYADLRPLVPQYVAAIPTEPNSSGGAGYMVRERNGNSQIVATRPELTEEIGINAGVSGVNSTPFGVDGVQIEDLGGNDFAYAVTIFEDSVYVGGTTSSSGGGDAFIMKYSINGDLDTSFGAGNGISILGNGQSNERITDIEIIESGEIFVVGRYGSGAGIRMQLLKLNSDGSVDTSFGSAGYVTSSTTIYSDDLEIDSDGNIYVAASETDGVGYTDALLLKYAPSGDLDSGFGNGGVVRYDNLTKSANHYIYGNALVLDSNGGVYLTGDSYDGGLGQYENMFVRKYVSSDGSLDLSFAGGTGMFESSGIDEGGYSIQIQGENLYVGGYDWFGDDWVTAVWKMNLAGVLDTSYGGGDGIAIDSISDEAYPGYGETLIVDSAGRVYLSGAIYSPTFEGMVTRFDSSGQLDAGFEDDGIWVSSEPDLILGLAMYGGYYLYAVGSEGNNSALYRFE